MKRWTLAAAAAVAAAIALTAPAAAQQKFRFAVVPKAMNNPFFDLSRDGCLKRAKELGNVECIYKGPVEHEPASQVQIIQDMISQKVDGLAISVSDVAAATRVIKAARDAGIPVITFDADAPNSARQAYIGTDNKAFGIALGKKLLELGPNGGKFGMISGGPAAANLKERVDGVLEALKGSKWVNVNGSPTFCNDDIALAVQQTSDLQAANPDLAGIVHVGGWALFAPTAYRAAVEKKKADMASGKFISVAADTLKVEVEHLRDGYVNALIGQRPFEMGEKAIDALLALKKGEKIPEIIYTGLDNVTKDNAAKFLSN